MYKLRFQPQPTASGSEVDATLNLLGTGMEVDRNLTLPPLKRFFPSTWIFLDVRCAVGTIRSRISSLFLVPFWCSHVFPWLILLQARPVSEGEPVERMSVDCAL